MVEYPKYDRLKKFEAKKGSTVSDWYVHNYEDNDTKLQFVNVQGESIYTNPPDPNIVPIDHRLEEDSIWNFTLDSLNQKIVNN